jgi:D-alanine-D-alanine ligase
MTQHITSPAQFGRVAVLMGGRSAEREISLNSGNQVLQALQRQSVDAHAVDVSFDIAQQLAAGKFDRAFNILHGRGGEDGEIQGFLQAIDMPYTGSGVSASVLSMNKRISKQNWQQKSLSTAKYQSVTAATDIEQLIADLGLPLFIKPVNEGSSIGMSKVSDKDQLQAAIELAMQYDADVIAEQWINGEEYTVGILAGEALPVIQLKTPHDFYDYEAKYQANTTQYLCPCGLSEQDEADCQQLALAAFKALGMEGWGRVDLMRHQDGQFYLLEANSVPGMTDHSLVPMAAKQAGLDFDALVWRVLETSMGGHA